MNPLNRTFFALTCVRMFDSHCSQVPHKILVEMRVPGPIFESIYDAKKSTLVLFFFKLELGRRSHNFSGCKPRALHRGHETLPYPSVVSLFLTLLYHVSPLAILFLCSVRRDISGHSRVAWEAR